MVLLCTLGSSCTSRPIEDSATGVGSTSSPGASTDPATVGPATTGQTATTSTTSDALGSSGTSSASMTSLTSETSVSTGEQTSSGDPNTDVPNNNEDCNPGMNLCPAGEKCVPYSGDGDEGWETHCVPIAPNPGQVGDPCTYEGVESGADSCDRFLMCWDVDPDTKEGHCVDVCFGQAEMPMCLDPGTACFMSGGAFGVVNVCLPTCDFEQVCMADQVCAYNGGGFVCLPACDPLQQDCAADKACTYAPKDGGLFICNLDQSGAGGQEFDSCEHASGCDAGLLCLSSTLAVECDQMATNCCLAICDVTMPMCIGQGSVCHPWYDMGGAPPGLENVGLCSVFP